MSEPLFLRSEDVEKLHTMAVHRFGGSKGLRDRNAFESAVNQPKNIFYYEQGDLFDMAAAYCFHIAQAQAFFDGKSLWKGSVQVFMLLAQETKYESFNKIYNTQKFSKTDKYADNPAQLDTAYIRSSTLIEILF